MNRTNTQKRLTLLAAICSSVFLLAACEPGTEQTGETTDETAPTYGEPDRDVPPPQPTPGEQSDMSSEPAETSEPSDAQSWEEDTGTDPETP